MVFDHVAPQIRVCGQALGEFLREEARETLVLRAKESEGAHLFESELGEVNRPLKLFKSQRVIDHLPSRELKAMSHDLHTRLLGLGADLGPSPAPLIDSPLPLPIDFTRCVMGLRTTLSGTKATTFYIAPNLSFDFYEIKRPQNFTLD